MKGDWRRTSSFADIARLEGRCCLGEPVRAILDNGIATGRPPRNCGTTAKPMIGFRAAALVLPAQAALTNESVPSDAEHCLELVLERHLKAGVVAALSVLIRAISVKSFEAHSHAFDWQPDKVAS